MVVVIPPSLGIFVLCIHAKEVLKSNFRQYGQMKQQRWEESKQRKEQERRSEKTKSQKKERAQSRFWSYNAENTSGSDHCWTWNCGKVHTAVARSTFRSENVQSTTFSEHFWKLRCWKGAVARSTLQSQNVQSTPRVEHLWKEVEMLKKCMTLWHEASYEAKTRKTHKKHVWTSPLKFAPRRWEHQSVGCPAYPPTKWYGDTYKMVAPMGVAAYKMVAPGYPTCPPTSSILGEHSVQKTVKNGRTIL